MLFFDLHKHGLLNIFVRAEGVDMTTISFINNQPCVDLIEKKPNGILTMLDEVCMLGRSTTDAAFLEALDKTHKVRHCFEACLLRHIASSYETLLQGKHAYYGNPKKKSVDRFSVLHFAGPCAVNTSALLNNVPHVCLCQRAGEVPYCIDGFIEKNNDTLYSDLEELMVTSTCAFLRGKSCGACEIKREIFPRANVFFVCRDI
jgi:hypothetical protein